MVQLGHTEAYEAYVFFKKWTNPGLILFIFVFFLDAISIIQIEKSVDVVLGIRTRGSRMVGADKTTELWRPPNEVYVKRTSFKLLLRNGTSEHSV